MADQRGEAHQPTFTGDTLREIAFPLGGIGTGSVSLGGRGHLRDWEIFNRPGKGKALPYTFFALYCEEEGGAPIARVLERKIQTPYSSGFGLSTGAASGLPRLREVTFRGEYPFAWLDFDDSALPVAVSLEAYNPFIPMNETDSGIPAAIFNWSLNNRSERPVRVTIAFSVLNAVGYNGQDALGNRYNRHFGQNLNEWREGGEVRGIALSSSKHDPNSPQFGSMAVMTGWDRTTRKTRWERAGWWDDIQNFWDELVQGRGVFPAKSEPQTATPDGQTDVASLGLLVELEPGEQATLPFVLSWYFPNLTNTWNGEESVKGKRIGNWYATRWENAWDVGRYAIEQADRLRAESLAYHECMFDSTLPAEVVDAAASNASILKTTTVLRTADGRLNGFEGCGDNEGCCPMNCTHVWDYAQAVAFLFPALERSVRITDFLHNTAAKGNMAFRTLLPLIDELWAFKPCADGQMGTILRAYREWLQCGDKEFLEAVWPGIVRALEYAWAPGSWDEDRDGVMEGEQHNTYDIEFYGPNTMCGLFYLGALRAAEQMALIMGDEPRAKEYRRVFESGRKRSSELLWNSEYFKQIVRTDVWEAVRGPMTAETHPDSMLSDTEPRYQYGEGCLADQLLGCWLGRVVGLEDLFPQEQVRSALSAIVRHNWKADLSTHESVQRVYAVNDEAGLLLCTWPNGGRPQYPFPYADEVWTGIEYQVAAHCIYEGLVQEGLAIVKGVRDRHDGLRRNPWDEFECGHHYARAMSSWSLLLAMSGYHYDAGIGHLQLKPVTSGGNFRCFFSAGTAWGRFSQTAGPAGRSCDLAVRWGSLALRSLQTNLDLTVTPTVTLDGRVIAASGTGGLISFVEPVTISRGSALRITL